MKNRIKSFAAKHDVEIATAVVAVSFISVGALAMYMTGRTIAAEAALAQSRVPIFVWSESDEPAIRASYHEPINL